MFNDLFIEQRNPDNPLYVVNTSRSRQSDRYFADEISEFDFLNENWCVKIKNSGSLFQWSNWQNNKMMAWQRTGEKNIPETMLA